VGILTSRNPDTPEGLKSQFSVEICRIPAGLPHSTEPGRISAELPHSSYSEESEIVLFCFSFIFVSFGESCLLVS
jgi:hypothetical protein